MSTNKQLVKQYEEQTQLLLEQYYDRGILKKEIRSYEVSLWTLQDDFITVLKWSDVEQKGRIESPKMTLNIDGTEKFNFSIPMYYRKDGKLIENPNWYNTQNGNLIMGLRKLKVIFNKGITNEEAVFEFVITNVFDNHENDISTCEVESEGLAFQELGKIGYKLELGYDKFVLTYEEWENKGYWLNRKGVRQNTEPIQNIKYWCEECAHLEQLPASLNATDSHTWYYDVRINQNSFEQKIIARPQSKIYEEPYTGSWKEDSETHTMVPEVIVASKEKARGVEAKNSNLYNITQSIAEAFGVFCRYEYLHDENYHIIRRTVVFYNSFHSEEMGTTVLQYPYTVSKTRRTLDSKDIATKLYVLDVENNSTLEGFNSIMNAPPNFSCEDYILNFDYLYETGGISKDQYDAIEPYLRKMREYNQKITHLQQQLNTYEIQEPEVHAKKTVYENSIKLDQEAIQDNAALRNAIDESDGDADGYFAIRDSNADIRTILRDVNDRPYIKLSDTNKGIKESSIKIYKKQTARGGFPAEIEENGKTVSNVVEIVDKKYDEYGNLTALKLKPSQLKNYYKVYLHYKYKPTLYYDNIINAFQIKLNDDTDGYNAQSALLDELNDKIEATKEELAIWIAEKQTAVQEFERLMGPALREGYWQPENYNDYGDYYQLTNQTINVLSNQDDINQDVGNGALIAWDTKLFDKEDKLYYEAGVEKAPYFYPCIDLTKVFPSGIPTDLDKYVVRWQASNTEITSTTPTLQDYEMLAVESKALIKFIKKSDSNDIIPVLVLVGAKTFSAKQLNYLIQSSTTNIASAGDDSIQVEDPSLSDNSENDVPYVDFPYWPTLEKYTVELNDENDNIEELHEDVHELRADESSSNPWLLYYYDNKTTADDDLDEIVSNQFQQVSASFNDQSEIADFSVGIVYPRVKFSSLSLKTDTSNLFIKYGTVNNKHLLKIGEDYYINTRDSERDGIYYTEYFITIKPATLIKYGYGNNETIDISYVLSNANTAIYLDALEVSKENAKPKVSYEVNVSLFNPNLLHTLYDKLARIVIINDTDLKFENVFGYISQLELDLDQPQNDTIEVKNYTTKFEDLFATIVASTEQMKQASEKASLVIGGGIGLSEEGLTQTLNNASSIMNQYLDSYFDSSDVVKEKLTDLFMEAGEVLSTSAFSINETQKATLKNADILGQFAEDVNSMSTNPIQLLTVNDSGFISAIELNPDKGVFIGSGIGVSLFSGVPGASAGASVELMPDHLILGYSNVTADNGVTNAIQIDENQVLIASGGETYRFNENPTAITLTGRTGSLLGASFKHDQIYFAISDEAQQNPTITTMIMRANGFTVGSGDIDLTVPRDNLRQSINGSYVRIAPDGVDIGSDANLYINTSNFKLQTDAGAEDNSHNTVLGATILAIGTDLNNINERSGYNITTGRVERFGTNAFDPYRDDNNNILTPQVNLLLNEQGLYVNTAFIAHSNQGSFVANGSQLGFYDTSGSAVLTLSGTTLTVADNYSLAIGGDLNVTSGGNINVNSTNLIINSQAALQVEEGQPEETMFRLGPVASPVLLYKNGVLTLNSSGDMVINSGNSFIVQSGGNVNITSGNLIINTNAGNNESIFKITDGEQTPTTYFDIAKNNSGGVFAKIAGWYIGGTHLGNQTGRSASTVGMAQVSGNYVFWAGGRYDKTGGEPKFSVTDTGKLVATSGEIGGWNFNASKLDNDSTGTSYVALSSSGDYAIWAGGETASSAPFSVTKTGTLTVTNIRVKNSNNSYTSLTDYPFYKLYTNYMIKSYTENSITLDTGGDGTVINFNSPSSLTKGWTGNVYTVKNKSGTELARTQIYVGATSNPNQSATGDQLYACYDNTDVSNTIVATKAMSIALCTSSGANISANDYSGSTKVKVAGHVTSLSLSTYWNTALAKGWENYYNSWDWPDANTSSASMTISYPGSTPTAAYGSKTFTLIHGNDNYTYLTSSGTTYAILSMPGSCTWDHEWIGNNISVSCTVNGHTYGIGFIYGR